MSNNYQPTKLEMLVCLLQKTGTSEVHTSVQALSVRIPTYDYASIEAMAKQSGLSRNKIFCQLIDLALSQVHSALPEEDSKQISQMSVQIYHEMIGGEISAGALSKLPQAEKGEC